MINNFNGMQDLRKNQSDKYIVCMHVCICIGVCMHMCKYICKCVGVYLYMSVWFLHKRTYANINVCVYV